MRWAAILGPSGTGKTTLLSTTNLTCIPGATLNYSETPATMVFTPRICGALQPPFAGLFRVFVPDFPGMLLARLSEVVSKFAQEFSDIDEIASGFLLRLEDVKLRGKTPAEAISERLSEPVYMLLSRRELYERIGSMIGVSVKNITLDDVRSALERFMVQGSGSGDNDNVVSWGATLLALVSSLLYADLVVLTLPATLRGWGIVAGDRLKAYGVTNPDDEARLKDVLSNFYNSLRSLLDFPVTAEGRRPQGKKGVRVLLLFTMLDLAEIDGDLKRILEDLAHLGIYAGENSDYKIQRAIVQVIKMSGISDMRVADSLTGFLGALSSVRGDEVIVDVGFSWSTEYDESMFMRLYLAWFAKFGDKQCSLHAYVVNKHVRNAIESSGMNYLDNVKRQITTCDKQGRLPID